MLAFDQRDAFLLNRVEGFVEQWNSCASVCRVEATAGVETLNFGRGFGGDLDSFSRPLCSGVCCAIQVVVVDYDELSVFGMVIIEFDEVGAGGDGEFE